ncbi:unnamed protein product [Prorocentrum cordatum]|uniref:Transposase IS200-like domain-containing protein n=1 Tax=Prorocentrum cordatum TaxID=2364126 RepID=A0ABN9R4J2_9DINO|nr:unnamed protein product [Polarella glacialis]
MAGPAASSYWMFYLLDAYKAERLRRAKEACGSAVEPASPDAHAVEDDARAASRCRADLIAAAATPERLRSAFGRHFQLDNYVHLVLQPGPDLGARSGACEAAAGAAAG